MYRGKTGRKHLIFNTGKTLLHNIFESVATEAIIKQRHLTANYLKRPPWQYQRPTLCRSHIYWQQTYRSQVTPVTVLGHLGRV